MENTMGLYIRTMRTRNHLSQDDLIAALKLYYSKPISKSTISTWENETANPPIHDNQFVEAVARVFNVSVADVLKGSGFDLGPAYESDLDETRRLLLEAYDNGSLETMVRLALEAHARRSGDHSRLSTEGENDGHTGNEATKSARR